MKSTKKRNRSIIFRKKKIFKFKYSNLISNIIKLKNILQKNENSVFSSSCQTIIGKKLYLLGLIKSIDSLNKETITNISIKKRMIKYILVKSQLAKTVTDAIILIKKKKIYVGSKLILNSNFLIDRESEKKIYINK
jgi:hypothetical protein